MAKRAQILIWVLAAASLTGCASGGRPAPTQGAGVQRITLTSAQSEAVRTGVRQMVASPDTARLSAVTAITKEGAPAVQVCGYVTTKDGSGKDGPDLPFYVELLEKDGKPDAARGQVGDAPAERSKVKFMCRNNG